MQTRQTACQSFVTNTGRLHRVFFEAGAIILQVQVVKARWFRVANVFGRYGPSRLRLQLSVPTKLIETQTQENSGVTEKRVLKLLQHADFVTAAVQQLGVSSSQRLVEVTVGRHQSHQQTLRFQRRCTHLHTLRQDRVQGEESNAVTADPAEFRPRRSKSSEHDGMHPNI